MTQKLTYISIGVLALLCVWLALKPPRIEYTPAPSNDSLIARIEQYEQLSQSYDLQIHSLRDSLEFIYKEIDLSRNRIKTLKRINHEKTAAISKYSSDELIKLLTDRYK
jgi:hypothetical protein